MRLFSSAGDAALKKEAIVRQHRKDKKKKGFKSITAAIVVHTVFNKCFQVARHSTYICHTRLVFAYIFVALKNDRYRRWPYDGVQDHLKSHVTLK